MISKMALRILACPECKRRLHLRRLRRRKLLFCAICRLGYPIRGSIPVLFIKNE